MKVALSFHLLTESEKECLRLVHAGHSSKAIAAQRKVRSDRIDKILNSARAKLDGLPRRDAARRFVEQEALDDQRDKSGSASLVNHSELTQSLGAQPLGVPDSGSSPSSDPTEMPTAAGMKGNADGMLEANPPPPQRAAFVFPLPFGDGGRQRNDLSLKVRAVTIVVIAAAGACTAGAAFSLLIVLNRLALGH